MLAAAVVALLGAWYWSGMSAAPADQSAPSSETARSKEETEDVDATVDKTESPSSTKASAPTVVESGGSVESDLAAIDSIIASENDYDDSDLDTTFSSEGANSLTDPYDY